jgi:FG-GAP repeat protein
VGSTIGPLNWFGKSIAVEGDWIVAGADRDDGPFQQSGVTYVFHYDAANATWVEHQRLEAPDAYSGHFFGLDVDLDADRILVGSAIGGYLFQYDAALDSWLFETKLTPATPYLLWASAVSLDGDVAVVAGPGDQFGGAYHQGTAFVFERDPVLSTWSLAQYLVAHDGKWAYSFGWDAAVSGDVIAVTAWDTDIPEVDGGAVYLHRRDPLTGHWSFFQRLGSPQLQSQTRYGFSVALEDGALLVGADIEAAAYLYEFDPLTGEYGLERRLEGEHLVLPYFGAGVALTEDWAAVGALRGNGVGNITGSSWVFDRETCAPVGNPYCGPAVPNSTGLSARLRGAGVALAGGQPLLMLGSQLPPAQPAMLLASLTQGLVQPPGSVGNLCLAGQIARFSATVTAVTGQGTAAFTVDTTAIPTGPPSVVLPGETWSFQVWFRDLGPTSNFSEGVALTFL